MTRFPLAASALLALFACGDRNSAEPTPTQTEHGKSVIPPAPPDISDPYAQPPGGGRW